MSVWTVLGGVVVGVGAVAAAPFTGGGSILAAGISLSGSLAGVGLAAGVAGAAGGALGHKVSASDRASGRREGKEEATAEYKIKLERLKERLEKTFTRIKNEQEYFNHIIAMTALGMTTAYADGNVDKDELEAIKEFTAGVMNSKLPKRIKQTIKGFHEKPPTFKESVSLIRKLKEPDLELFRELIELVSHIDGHVCDKEKALLSAFNKAFSKAS